MGREEELSMDYEREARELVSNLSQRMGPSAYDIAWMARLKSPTNGHACWPNLVEWLVTHQHADGSWGGQIVYYHERIVCTLAAVIALRYNDETRPIQAAIERGVRYVWHHLHLLSRDPFELVGFELILPTLLQEAQALGLDVPSHTCGYGEIQIAKLQLIPPDFLYSPRVTTIHSLEFLGPTADAARLRAAIADNGSLGNSPATTAYYLTYHPDDQRAWTYLDTMQQRSQHVIYLYPFRIFELNWVLNNLMFSGRPIDSFTNEQIWQDLQANVREDGISLDPSFGIPDGDTTSVGAKLLLSFGHSFDPLILSKFEDKKNRVFRTYNYERNASIGTNVHALEALRLMPDYPERAVVQAQITRMLLDSRVYAVYWIDKWHTSPYYATAHALVALLAQGDHLHDACDPSIEWLIHTQHADGSWGFFQQGTAEETAYALTALLNYHKYQEIDPDILHRGADYLARTHQGPTSLYPELWIGKDLFAPYDIVRAAILAALMLYQETLGRNLG